MENSSVENSSVKSNSVKNNFTNLEKLGIIGGLGPAATMLLASRIVNFTDVPCDQDHIDITILNRPWIPDRSAYLTGKPNAQSFIPPIVKTAKELEDMGCTVLCMPCNTAHCCLPEIEQHLTRARVVSMPQETANQAARLGCTRVGILATDGTRVAKVYDQACQKAGIQPVWPNDEAQKTVMKVVYDDVKAGKSIDASCLHDFCNMFLQEGCDGVILGCTELSVLDYDKNAEEHMPNQYGIVLIDALNVLARRCVEECGAPIKRSDFQNATNEAGFPSAAPASPVTNKESD